MSKVVPDRSEPRSNPSQKPDETLQYEEVTTFGDSLPTKNATFVSATSDSDEDGSAFAKNPFLDPDVADHWTRIYEKSQYECRHVFDPNFSWTEEEERRLVRRLDWRVCLWACVMFFGLQVDRGNLVQAVADNLLNDLNLTTDEYNLGNNIFLFSFLLAELPSQLVSKKIGPDRWIPMQISLWSIVAMSQCAIQGKSGFYATRSMLGLLEVGSIASLLSLVHQYSSIIRAGSSQISYCGYHTSIHPRSFLFDSASSGLHFPGPLSLHRFLPMLYYT